jgi:hypothetical protein
VALAPLPLRKMGNKLANPESLEKERIPLASEALTITSEQACEPLKKEMI